MTGQAMPAPALRPMLPEDVAVLAAILVASVEELTGDDYSEAQQAAWISVVDDEPAFGKRIRNQLTLVATMQNSRIGFASLKGTDRIDLLYVHPGATGRGVAAMLIDALERLAGARGATALSVDASDTAEGFFARRGYVAAQRNSVTVGDEWLANTTMKKTLAPASETPS